MGILKQLRRRSKSQPAESSYAPVSEDGVWRVYHCLTQKGRSDNISIHLQEEGPEVLRFIAPFSSKWADSEVALRAIEGDRLVARYSKVDIADSKKQEVEVAYTPTSDAIVTFRIQDLSTWNTWMHKIVVPDGTSFDTKVYLWKNRTEICDSETGECRAIWRWTIWDLHREGKLEVLHPPPGERDVEVMLASILALHTISKQFQREHHSYP